MKPQSAAVRAEPGDFIYLRGGIYDERHAGRGRGYNGLLNTFNASSGRPGAVITLKSYPGERAILKPAEAEDPGIWVNRSYWRIEGLKIEGGNIGVARPFVPGVNHIWIVDNEVSDIVARLGNAGLIKLDGNTGEDPRDIYIWNNKIHDLSARFDSDMLRQVRQRRGLPPASGTQQPARETRDRDTNTRQPGRGAAQSGPQVVVPWNEDIDTEHHACITVMRGTGLVEIKGNEAYNCAAILYFKYEWDGPVVIEGNRFHHAQTMGEWRNSNNEFRNNIVHDVEQGIRARGYSQSHTIENNTFVGLSYVFSAEFLAGHTLRDNVVFGSGYLLKGSEPQGELSESNSDSNCFITAPNFSALGLGPKATGLSGLNLQYGLDRSSVRFTSTDRKAVFADPDAGDFSLIGEATERCQGDGATTAGGSHSSSH